MRALCQTASNDQNQIFRRPTAVRPTFSIFSTAVSGSASERAVPTDYSTMSAFVLLMKPNTSVRSAAGTSKVSRVVSRWPIKRCQSPPSAAAIDRRKQLRSRHVRRGAYRAYPAFSPPLIDVLLNPEPRLDHPAG